MNYFHLRNLAILLMLGTFLLEATGLLMDSILIQLGALLVAFMAGSLKLISQDGYRKELARKHKI